MKIKNKHAHYSNSKFLLPEIGERQLIDGEVEVPDNIGEALIANGDQWINCEAIDLATDEINEEVEKGIKLSDEDKTLMIESVKTMEHEELLEVANSSKIKGANLFQSPDKIEILRKLVIKNIEKL